MNKILQVKGALALMQPFWTVDRLKSRNKKVTDQQIYFCPLIFKFFRENFDLEAALHFVRLGDGVLSFCGKDKSRYMVSFFYMERSEPVFMLDKFISAGGGLSFQTETVITEKPEAMTVNDFNNLLIQLMK